MFDFLPTFKKSQIENPLALELTSLIPLSILKTMKQSFREFQLHVIFRPEPEGGFTVLVPALPGCITYGKNLKEAKHMVMDAISGYLASLKKHGEAIPSDEDSFISTVQISSLSNA